MSEIIFAEFDYLTTLSESTLHRVGGKMINEYGAVGGVRIGKGNRSIRGKPGLVPLCPPQVIHELTWDRIRVALMGRRPQNKGDPKLLSQKSRAEHTH
jgi:hypothetical protein